MVRDTALRASGLLSAKLGGPSVFPPQPPGVSSEAFGSLDWKTSTGEDRFRRGLYTFSKRTAPYAVFAAFDAPSGEACVARREVSNSPLQSLTLLNDLVFLEAAQALGRAIAPLPGSDDARAVALFRRILVRPPDDEERAAIVKFCDAQRARIGAGELDAGKIAGTSEADVASAAVWTLAARSLLNLDEFVTKE